MMYTCPREGDMTLQRCTPGGQHGARGVVRPGPLALRVPAGETE